MAPCMAVWIKGKASNPPPSPPVIDRCSSRFKVLKILAPDVSVRTFFIASSPGVKERGLIFADCRLQPRKRRPPATIQLQACGRENRPQTMDIQTLIEAIVEQVKRVDGVCAIVL